MSIQTIYNRLRAAGMTEAGALATMGNFRAESGLVACRLQGDFQPGLARSKQYAQDVDDGKISRHIFQYDAQGWGLAQWTYFTRKARLYDFCRAQGKSIGDEGVQLDFTVKELKDHYPDLWLYLCSTGDLYKATQRVCSEYERPAVENVQQRFGFAKQIREELAAGAAEDPIAQATEFWPPRTIDRNMTGADVEVLQAILKARGYAINFISGKFSALTEQEAKRFQADHGLVQDGVIGPKSWAALLERR